VTSIVCSASTRYGVTNRAISIARSVSVPTSPVTIARWPRRSHQSQPPVGQRSAKRSVTLS
jgi:hypothetical protein